MTQPDLKHSPGRTESDGQTHCVLCGLRIFQNTARVEPAQEPDAWAHITPQGSTAAFWFTCPGWPTGHKPLAEHILSTVGDLVGSFLFYDRKEDEDLPQGTINAAVSTGVITIDQMVEKFRSDLTAALS